MRVVFAIIGAVVGFSLANGVHELLGVLFGAFAGFAVSAAVSLAAIPRNVSIVRATLADPETSGGDSRLAGAPRPYPWKTGLLWSILIAGAALLAWMALRLARDVR